MECRLTVLIWLATLLAGPAGQAQPDSFLAEPSAQPAVRMETLLEKTIFKVNVLQLDLWLGPDTARQLGPQVGGSSPAATPDSVASVAIHSQDSWARITFLRGVGLDRFLDGIGSNLKRVRQAGILTEAEYTVIADGLPVWFSPLRERDIHKGDQLFYRIRGDTLRTVFRTSAGQILIDQTDVGPERRLSVLGGFLIAGSDFRKGLLASLKGGG